MIVATLEFFFRRRVLCLIFFVADARRKTLYETFIESVKKDWMPVQSDNVDGSHSIETKNMALKPDALQPLQISTTAEDAFLVENFTHVFSVGCNQNQERTRAEPTDAMNG